MAWGYFIATCVFLILSLLIFYFLNRGGKLLIDFNQILQNFKKINFKKYFKFGFLIAINKNLGTLFSLLPVTILGIFALSSDVAYFNIAFAYIGIPLMALDPISRLLGVQLPKSKTYGIEMLKKHFYRVSLWSGLVSLFLIIPFTVFGPILIKFFYGAEYINSIKLVYWLALFGIISGFSVGLGSIYRTLNKMKISIIITLGQTVFTLLVMIFLIKFLSPLMSIVFALIIPSAIFLFINFYVIKKVFEREN